VNKNKAYKLLIEVITALEWSIAIPKVDDDMNVPGLVIGKRDYIDWVLKCIGNKSLPIKLRKKSNG
jgi:hypothetical protein